MAAPAWPVVREMVRVRHCPSSVRPVTFTATCWPLAAACLSAWRMVRVLPLVVIVPAAVVTLVGTLVVIGSAWRGRPSARLARCSL